VSDITVQNFSALNLIDSGSTVRQLAPSLTGALLWNASQLVDINDLSSYSTTTAMNTAIATALGSYTTTATLNTLLGTKQDALANYSETAGATTTIVQTFDDATPISTHLAWGAGAYANVSNNYQEITIPVYHTFTGLGSGTAFMTVQLKAGTCNEAVFSINNSTAWVQVYETKFSNLSASTWTTCSWQFTIPTNSVMNFHIGYVPPGSSFTQAGGIVLLKNLHLYKTTAAVTISSQLNCSGDVICSRTVSATSYTSTSDESIKENVQNASIEDCMEIFQIANVKTYNRKDIPGQRIGFIAQEIEEYLPPEFANVIGM